MTFKPSATIMLCHYLIINRKELWVAKTVRDMAREAMKERDELALRVVELEKQLKDAKVIKFQGMTDLA